MRYFSSKQKVYTTDSAAINESEDVGVEGKRYPTHAYGRFITRFPALVCLTFLVPFVFFVIGCVKIQQDMSYLLDDYQIRSTIPVRQDAVKINSVLDTWAAALTGEEILNLMLDKTHERSTVQDTMELRAIVDLPALFKFAKHNNINNATRDSYGNLLNRAVYTVYHSVETLITQQDGYEQVCFTNNLKNTQSNIDFPTCAPVSSMSQYLYPKWDDIEWNMDGTGSTYQLDILPRLFVNPNYGWFFDANFSTLNPIARQLRSQFTFASSRGDTKEEYVKRMKKFLPHVMQFVNSGAAVQLDFVKFYLGGGSSQTVLMGIAGSREGYKIGVAAVICFVISWWHSGTFVIGLYTVFQTIVVHMGAVGLYALIYGTLPVSTYPAIIWVTTFCMHGTLSFYDMFVFSGIMATKGRQNNLSVAQRLCFTIRRISMGVWIADVLAIIIFAINTTSLFNSVVQFSVLMMIALLWNMYCIVLPTPALVVLHHMYFSNKRRNLQKQSDVLSAAMVNCRRPRDFVTVLGAIQDNVAEGEWTYWQKVNNAKAGLGLNGGINKMTYTGPMNFIRVQLQAGMNKVRAARHDVVGALHKARKTKQLVVDGEQASGGELPAIQLEDFLQVGDANPLVDDADAIGKDGQPLYYNSRMVFPSDLIHIPGAFVERSEESWMEMCGALGQVTLDAHGDVIPPHAYSLKKQGTNESGAAVFADRWRVVGTKLEVETTPSNRAAELVPLAVRNVIRAQDPTMVVDPYSQKAPRQRADTSVAVVEVDAGAAPATTGPTGMGVRKLRHRWLHRNDMTRTGFCGMFGKVANETPDERMRRLMRRKVKRDGYSFFERFLLNYYLPGVYAARFVFLFLLFALFIALCIAGSFVTAGGLPNTLIAGQESAADMFASMDGTFGQRGDCTFCGPYYRSISEYRRSTIADIAICSPTYGEQMNLYTDKCGVCNGTNACVDCAGTVNGSATLDNCGGCSTSSTSSSTACTCDVTRDCSYCEWAFDNQFVAPQCSAVCTSGSQCGSHGKCNQYTATCDCDAGYGGSECTNGIDCGLHGKLNPTTTFTCNCDSGWSGMYCNISSECGGRGRLLNATESPTGAEMCGCAGHWRGATCQVCDCLNGGMCDDVTGECSCAGAFVGPRCETCAANCTARGTCPDVTTPDYSLWNVRACIGNACTKYDSATKLYTFSEELCSACSRTGTTAVTTQCSATTDKTTCLANTECWWYTPTGGSAYCGLARVNNDTSSLDCKCTSATVWSGGTCGTCLAAPGASCLNDGTVLGCNGLTYASASQAPGTDACGVCSGNGLCRGCDGIPGSGKVYDACGVCGGDGTCDGGSSADPVYVDYLFDLTSVPEITHNPNWCKVVATVAASVRASDSTSSQSKSIIEDYLADVAGYYIISESSLYYYAKANGRLSEVVYTINFFGNPVSLLYIRYRVESTVTNSKSSPIDTVSYYYWIEKYLVGPYRALASANGVSLSYTSTTFQPAVAKVGALQSLWFAVGIGLAVTFVFLLVYYVSMTMAALATMVAAIVCFGSLTVCKIFGWEVDAVLQVCISCTVPIGVEYVVHFCSGYFDYLQTTTSHLFAKDVTRRTAVQGALLRSASAVCSSAVTVIFISIMYDVSPLTPLRRCGQISITLHLLILLAGVFFTGAVAAFGPMKAYQHWTISTAICIACAILAAIAVLIMYGANGVRGPHANKILTK